MTLPPPTAIAREMGSPAQILLLWVVGGGLCLLGAFTFAELATLYPRSGGLYVFLREGLGECPAFVFGWTYLLLTQPLALAAMATVFAEHLLMLLGATADKPPSGFLSYENAVPLVTCLTILLVTGVNVTGMKRGAGVAVLLTGFKTLVLAAIVVAALATMKGNALHFAPVAAPRLFLAALAPVLVAILWTYDGWSDVAAVAEEVREPQRQIPRIFLLGTVGITVLYVAVNATYFWLVPLEEMRATDTIAPLVMQRLFGPAARTVVTVMILGSVLGSTHASAIVGSRVMFAQARDGLLFRFLGRVHARFQTPSPALWAQAVLGCVASLGVRHFERLIGGFVFTIWIFYGLAALSIFTLRARRPELLRPFRCWGYPVTPALFILAAAGMLVASIVESQRATLPWLGVLLLGVPVFYLWKWRGRESPRRT